MKYQVFLIIWASTHCYGAMPLCDDTNQTFSEFPVCLPLNYNKDIVPPTDDKPVHINVDMWIFEVSKIDDHELTMTFELYLDLTWKEERLLINNSASSWGPEGVLGSVSYVHSLWKPDVQILNLKEFRKRNIVGEVGGIIFFQDKRVLYTVSTEAVLSCPMKFSAYPLDHQVKSIKLVKLKVT